MENSKHKPPEDKKVFGSRMVKLNETRVKEDLPRLFRYSQADAKQKIKNKPRKKRKSAKQRFIVNTLLKKTIQGDFDNLPAPKEQHIKKVYIDHELAQKAISHLKNKNLLGFKKVGTKNPQTGKQRSVYQYFKFRDLNTFLNEVIKDQGKKAKKSHFFNTHLTESKAHENDSQP